MKDSCKENIELFVVFDSFNVFTFSLFNSLEDVIGLQVSVNIKRKPGFLNERAYIETSIFSSLKVINEISLNSLVGNFGDDVLFGDVGNIFVMGNINGINLLSSVCIDLI